MTLFDRALSKAYAMRSAPLPEPPAAPVPVERGWVARLRTPAPQAVARLEEAIGPADKTSTPEKIGTAETQPIPVANSGSTAEPAAAIDPRDDVVYPPDLLVRVDASHAEPIATGEAASWAWPAISHKLLQSTAGTGLIGLADTLESNCIQRRIRSLAITGPGRGTGRTTLLLTLARLLVERTSLRILLVDFDFGNPSLAAILGISPTIDTSHFVYAEVSASETLAELIPHRFGLLPLAHPMLAAELTLERRAVLRDLLRGFAASYDLTLIDAGPCDSMLESMCADERVFDACLAVSRHKAEPAESALPESLLQTGTEFLGTVETFVPAVSRNEPHFIRQ